MWPALLVWALIPGCTTEFSSDHPDGGGDPFSDGNIVKQDWASLAEDAAKLIGGELIPADALALKQARLERALTSKIAAISVGLVDGQGLLDLEYREDSNAQVDFNVIGTDAGTYVELQGTAEGKPFDRAATTELLDLADGNEQCGQFLVPGVDLR